MVLPSLVGTDRTKAELGNCLAEQAAAWIRLCSRLNISSYLENGSILIFGGIQTSANYWMSSWLGRPFSVNASPWLYLVVLSSSHIKSFHMTFIAKHEGVRLGLDCAQSCFWIFYLAAHCLINL